MKPKPATPAPKKTRVKSSILTEKQELYKEGVLDGKPKKQALLDAGFSPGVHSHDVDKIQKVKDALAMARGELSSAAQVERADVLAGFLDAIQLARTMADPTAMISGWREVGKMLGLYEPEVKKIELTAGQAALRGKLEVMTDEELLAISEGVTLEGESRRVGH